MMNYYSPHTGELIETATPSSWMGKTEIAPPAFDRATQGCFFRSGAWVIVDATPEAAPDYSAMRAQAYRDESDPLYFKYQRGEATNQEWIDKVAEIKARWPE